MHLGAFHFKQYSGVSFLTAGNDPQSHWTHILSSRHPIGTLDTYWGVMFNIVFSSKETLWGEWKRRKRKAETGNGKRKAENGNRKWTSKAYSYSRASEMSLREFATHATENGSRLLVRERQASLQVTVRLAKKEFFI